MRLEAQNIEALARHLAADLEPAISAGAMGIAAVLQDVLAPYPPPPSGSMYQRGRDKRSEQLNQRWRVRPAPAGAVLENAASYSRWVHGSPKERPGQTKVHQGTGWTNEDDARKQVVESGQANEIMERALRERLEVFR
jgi:hypothetical protein